MVQQYRDGRKRVNSVEISKSICLNAAIFSGTAVIVAVAIRLIRFILCL